MIILSPTHSLAPMNNELKVNEEKAIRLNEIAKILTSH